ncbi:MAG: hypothetical protein Q8L48_27000 [Archangium sp.]|nr:hypothetical protein [Archangium sp.]
MPQFQQVAGSVVGELVSAGELHAALHAVGPSAQLELQHLGRIERGMMADRLIRNLKSLGVHRATELERELLEQLEATPAGRYSSKLDGAVSLVELRSHLKQSLTGIGLGWEELTRTQSLVAGVARWLQAIGGASMEVMSSANSVDFRLTAEDRQLTPSLVRQSPLIQMLCSHSARFDVNKADTTVEITFSIQRAA